MNNKIQLLLVEDDPNLGGLLTEYLNAKGFDVKWAKDGEKGFSEFKRSAFDFLILDVMMPKKDGFTLAKEIREINSKIPLLFLTAKSMPEDTLQGFNVGGDDYMSKPFSMEELLVRIHAILRRSGADPAEEQISQQVGEFAFDPNTRVLSHNGDAVKLTTKESQLLYLLSKKKNDVLERNYALNAIWGDDNYFNGRSMDVYIAKLRKYLKKDPSVEIINVHGRGFKLLSNK